MLLIDRYLTRQFAQSFAICFCSLTGLYIIIDAFNNLDEFVTHGSEQGGVLRVIVEYYSYKCLGFFDGTSGILTLIAAMFTVAGFQRHNELTALLAAGIPKWRIVQPVIVAVLLISCLAAINREVVIPHFREQLARTTKDMGGETATKLEPRRDKKTDILLNGRETVARDQAILQPSFQILSTELNLYGSQLTAERAVYQTATDERPGGYLLEGVQYPNDLATQPSLPLGGPPVLITPHDAKWLKPNECFVVSEVTFQQLAGGAAYRQYSSTIELIQGLRNSSLDFGADVRVAIHARLIQPLLDVTLLFLGLPLVLSRQNRNMFVAAGLGVAVVTAFMLVVFGFQYLGSRYVVSPALAAWLPLMIFVPVAAGLSETLRE